MHGRIQDFLKWDVRDEARHGQSPWAGGRYQGVGQGPSAQKTCLSYLADSGAEGALKLLLPLSFQMLRNGFTGCQDWLGTAAVVSRILFPAPLPAVSHQPPPTHPSLVKSRHWKKELVCHCHCHCPWPSSALYATAPFNSWLKQAGKRYSSRVLCLASYVMSRAALDKSVNHSSSVSHNQYFTAPQRWCSELLLQLCPSALSITLLGVGAVLGLPPYLHQLETVVSVYTFLLPLLFPASRCRRNLLTAAALLCCGWHPVQLQNGSRAEQQDLLRVEKKECDQINGIQMEKHIF